MNGTGRLAGSASARLATGERRASRTRPARARPAPPRARGADPAWRLGMTAAVAALITLTAIVFGVLAVRPAPSAGSALRAAPSAATARPAAAQARSPAPARGGRAAAQPRGTAPSAPSAPSAPAASAPAASAPAVSLVLTAADRRDCPAAAAACVDLTRHITWLQAAGQVTFGPVQMEPGEPGGKHQTPRGTFHVAWKAGPTYFSTIYHEAMPWATFFAAGGIAFHGGSLTQWSHGCVHLTVANAHYYNENLPIGAEVVVF